MDNKLNKIGKIPFIFEKNMGQYNNESKFILKNSKSTIFFLESEIIFALMKVKKDKAIREILNKNFLNEKNMPIKECTVGFFKMILENSNKNPQILGLEEFDFKINYFKGNDPNKWKTDIEGYKKIIYKEVYQGIDLLYYENQGTLEYDFIIKPNADIDNIKISFKGTDKIEQDKYGNILIFFKENIIQMLKPKAYQEIDNKKIEIESNFIIDNNIIRFNISSYDKSKVLVIDPPLLYGTYIGGNDHDYGEEIAIDKNKNAYITGYTFSYDFPIEDEYQGNLKGDLDAFLIKIDTNESGEASLKYGTYIGGRDSDAGNGIAVDENENAYITGYTSSDDFPITIKSAYQGNLKGIENAFLIKIDTNESGEASLKYGTYIGGRDSDAGNGIEIDKNGNIYITGTTMSDDFPIKNAYQGNFKGGLDAFLIKIDTNESGEASLKYGTYIGGRDSDVGNGIEIDKNGNIYITGYTMSDDFPIKNAYQGNLKGTVNAFLIKIDTNEVGEASLKYGTYIGGSYSDFGKKIAIDENENVYITGYTFSDDFPIKNAYQGNLKGDLDAFLIKIDTNESGEASLKYGTYIGGNNYDSGEGIAVDKNENAYITGYTNSDDVPIKNAYQENLKGKLDVFLIKIDTNKVGEASLKYGTYIGGKSINVGEGIAVDESENAYITGYTRSDDFPIKNAFQNGLKGDADTFLIKINTLVCELELEKFTHKDKAFIGEQIPYIIKVTNKGPDKSTNIVVTDKFSKEALIKLYYTTSGSISESENTITWIIPDLEAGESVSAIIVVTADKNLCNDNLKDGAFILNNASLICDNGLLNTSVTKTNLLTYIECKLEKTCDMKVEKSISKNIFEQGEKIFYTIKVLNNGPSVATNIEVTDIIDQNASINSIRVSVGNINQIGNTVVWTIDKLDIGEMEIASILIIPNSNLYNDYIISTATLNCDNDILNPANATDKIIVFIEGQKENSSDLKLIKSTCNATVKIGEKIKYIIKIKNNGPDVATNVVVTDDIDNRLKIISLNLPGGIVEKKENLVIWKIPTLAVGEEIVGVIIAISKRNVANLSITNTANVKSDNILVNPQNSTSTVKVYISSCNCCC